MKFRFIIFSLIVVSLHWHSVAWAELQGPKPIRSAQPNDGTSVTDGDAESETTVANNEESVSAYGSASDESPRTTAATASTATDGSAIGNSNERKSSKFIEDSLNSEYRKRSKILQAAIFERLVTDKLMKQNLKEKIEEIELKMAAEAVAPIDPTTEQIEAQSLYEKAMEMIRKPRSDKHVAYALIRKAAEMNNLQARAELAWAQLLGHYLQFDFEYAAKEFEDLASHGLPEAHMGLAFLYSVGVGGKNISQPLTLIHLTLAALGDHTFAQMALGYRYSFGINVPINCEKSLMYYKKVAKKVASKITFSNGPIVHRVRLLDESENPGNQETEIVDYYQLLADKGDVQSQVGLGTLYYQGGKAIQQDHQKALEYFTQAANAGNAIGFAFLGKLYLEGSDYIKADNETAFKYFKKAADLGDPVGQSGLGLMYLKGLGVQKDPLKALNYFTQAAEQGWVDGQLQLGNMYFTGNGVKPDFKIALKYFNLASQSGNVLAYYNLGIMHAYGMGMLRSCPAAVEFFKNVAERGRWSTNLMNAYGDYKENRIDEAFMQYALLAELGYEVAQGNAAFLLDRNEVTIFHDRHEDLIRAFYYWKRAAAQGYSAAQVKLGDYYYYGWGTNIDFETAAALYRKASEQQYNAQAMFNLGYMHEQGLGMKKDWHLAKRLYDLAAETNADAKVPVAMALMKLQVLAKIENLKESPYKFIFYLDENIAANWDLYMITILTLLLGFIMYTRRPYQQQEQQQPPPQAQAHQQQQPLVNDNHAQPNANAVESRGGVGEGGASVAADSSAASSSSTSSANTSAAVSSASASTSLAPATVPSSSHADPAE